MASERTVLARAKKVGITIGGGALLVIGIIAIPYPGPGWLIVFAALGLLAQEYPWARRVLAFARKLYDGWNAWIRRQNWVVRSVTFVLTGLIVITTLWLLNAYGIVIGWLHLDWSWAISPFAQ